MISFDTCMPVILNITLEICSISKYHSLGSFVQKKKKSIWPQCYCINHEFLTIHQQLPLFTASGLVSKHLNDTFYFLLGRFFTEV